MQVAGFGGEPPHLVSTVLNLIGVRNAERFQLFPKKIGDEIALVGLVPAFARDGLEGV